MQTAIRRRTFAAAVALSIAAHGGLLAGLAVYRPMIDIPDEDAGPPFPIIPILLEPRALPPQPGGGGGPRELRLHRRPIRIHPGALPLPPLITRAVETPLAAPTTAPVAIAERAPVAAPAQVRAALQGLFGCANPASLTREQRDACDRRLASGGKTAPSLGLGVEPGKAAALDRAVARNAADYDYKRFKSAAPPSEQPGAPVGQAEALSRALGNDRPAAKVAF